MKIIVLVAFGGILAALVSAGLLMIRKRDDAGSPHADARMARALAWRVGISVGLFLFVLLGWSLGWIQPTGLPVLPR